MKMGGNTKKLFMVFIVLSFGTFLLWLYLFCGNVEGSQKAVFFGDSHDWFMDWFNVVYYSIGKKPYIWGLTEERSLPPLTFLLLYPFTKLYGYDVTGWAENESRYEARYSQLPMDMFLMVMVLSYLLLFYALYKSSRLPDIRKALLFGILFLSGVNFFCIDRGNLQVITAAAIFLYIYLCYDEKGSADSKLYKTVTGCAALAFAADIKLFPAIMGVLLLYRKKWKSAILAFVLGMAGFLLPFLWMEQPLFEAMASFIMTAGEHAASYLTIAEFGFSTPMLIGFTGLSHGVLQVAAYVAFVVSLATAWSLRSYWKQIMLLTLTLVMTSGQQGYYCLMFFFLPIVLFFNEEHGWKDIFYVLCFVLMLTPVQRSVYVGDVLVTMRDVINIVLIVLYIELLVEAARGAVRDRIDRDAGRTGVAGTDG